MKKIWKEPEVYEIISNKWPNLLKCVKEIVFNARQMNGDVIFARPNKQSESWSGFFEHDSQKITIFFEEIEDNNLSWLPVLIHEFNHLIQWVNKTECGQKYFKIIENKNVDYSILNRILTARRTKLVKGLKDNKWNKRMIKCLIDFESECDSMSVEMMKAGGFEEGGYVDIKNYIKEANIYFYKLLFLMKSHKWVCLSDNGDEKIRNIVPAGVLINSKEVVTKEIEKVFLNNLD